MKKGGKLKSIPTNRQFKNLKPNRRQRPEQEFTPTDGGGEGGTSGNWGGGATAGTQRAGTPGSLEVNES